MGCVVVVAIVGVVSLRMCAAGMAEEDGSSRCGSGGEGDFTYLLGGRCSSSSFFSVGQGLVVLEWWPGGDVREPRPSRHVAKVLKLSWRMPCAVYL
jgi:hypothetical protein